jgi:Resolvase, N terminal domain/Recombinase/Recombinase zinc beta ribbon domain
MDDTRMKIAYSYVRFSTTAQGKEGKDSTRRQAASSKSWCERNSYTLSNDRFLDAGKSGFKGQHIEKDGDLTRFIKLVKQGDIPAGAVLIIDSVDRFSRLPPTRSLELFLGVINAGIGLVFSGSYVQDIITRKVIDDEPNVLQFVIGEMIRSYRESAEKSRKVKEALSERRAKMKRGEIVAHNNIPRFFAYDSATKKYIPHPENAPVVLELVQGILDGKSLFGLAGEMNKRGVRTFRRGYCWAGTSIRKILQSRTLLGEFLGQKNFLPPLIDAETFDRVQNILRNNRVYGRGKKSELPNIFKGVCFCADCNHVMNVNTQWVKDVQYRYLVCSGQRGQSPCPNKKSIRLAEIEEEFFLEYLVQEPDSLVNDDERQELKSLRADKTVIETKIATIGRKIENLLAMGGDAQAADIPELKKNLAKLNSERAKAHSALDDINAQIRNLADAPNVREEAREVFFKTIEFGDGPNGEDLVSYTYTVSEQRMKETLADTTTREKIRLAMPSLIGKMTVDGTKGRWFIYNRAGKMIYKSRTYASNRNNSQRWKASLATWTTRSGKAVKRKIAAPVAA